MNTRTTTGFSHHLGFDLRLTCDLVPALVISAAKFMDGINT